MANLDGEQDVEGAKHIVVLRVHGSGAVDHGVGSASLLPKMDDGIWAEALHHIPEKVEVQDVAHLQIYDLARDLRPPAAADENKLHCCACSVAVQAEGVIVNDSADDRKWATALFEVVVVHQQM